jgi:hypothetical protein
MLPALVGIIVSRSNFDARPSAAGEGFAIAAFEYSFNVCIFKRRLPFPFSERGTI